MAGKKKTTFVVITEDARQRYSRDLLLPRLMASGHHFECESAVQEAAFLLLKVTLARQHHEPFVFELSIPIADVLYYLRGEDRKQLGFIEEQLSSAPSTANTE